MTQEIEAIKVQLIGIIRSKNTPYQSIRQALLVSGLVDSLDHPAFVELEGDKEVLFELEKLRHKCQYSAIELCKHLAKGENSGRPNEKFMSLYLKAIADEETLARIGGGGVRLDDVKSLGNDNRKNILIVADPNMIPEAAKQLAAPSDKPKRGRPRKEPPTINISLDE